MQGESQEFVAGRTDKTALPVQTAPITPHIIPEVNTLGLWSFPA